MCFAFLVGLLHSGLVLAIDALPNSTAHAAPQEPTKVQLIPVEADVVAARQKSLTESGPENARLVAYLDCGSQDKSTTTEEVGLTWTPGKVYRFLGL